MLNIYFFEIPKPTISNLNIFSQILISILSSIKYGELWAGFENIGWYYCNDYHVPFADYLSLSPSNISHWVLLNLIWVYFRDTVFIFTMISQSYDLPILNIYS